MRIAGKTVFVPLIEKGQPMKMYKIDSVADLEPKKVFKSVEIWQPKNPESRLEVLDSDSLDLIIMPGVCFDVTGARLGRGKGYYDTFIKKCKAKFPNVKTVGLAFEEQIVEPGTIPMMEHDQYLDQVIYYTKEEQITK